MNVEELLARTEIHQVLMRYCRAVDRGDVDELRMVYHESGTDVHGTFTATGQEFAQHLVAKHDSVDLVDGVRLVSQHHITNVLVEFVNTGANVESYFIATQPYQNPSEQPAVGLIGGRYLDRFDYRDERWAISERRIVIDWSRANIDGADWPGAAGFPVGGRREEDPSASFFQVSLDALNQRGW